MTKEITMKEAVDEINRLTRERDAIRAQLEEAEKTITHLRIAKNCYYDCVDKREANQRIAEAQEKAMEIARPMVQAAEARADAAEKKLAELIDTYTAEAGAHLRSEQQLADQRDTAESAAQRMRVVLEKVEAWMAEEQTRAPLFALWEDGDIGDYEERDGGGTNWTETLANVRNLDMPIDKLGIMFPTRPPSEVILYREIRAALGDGKDEVITAGADQSQHIHDKARIAITTAILLSLHRRFHEKVGCPGGQDCYVCDAESKLAGGGGEE